MSAKKAKADRRKVAQQDGAHHAPTRVPSWPFLAIRILGALGLGIGMYLSVLHYQAGAEGGIDSAFCGTGTTVNCSLVLSSAYATLFGVPVALWATAAYAALLATTLLSSTGLSLFLCGWIFVFSAYMAELSFITIGAICPLCMSLYLINIGLLISAFVLGRANGALTTPRLAYILTGFAVVLLGIGLAQTKEAATAVTPQQFIAPAPADMDMSFVRYYQEQPAVVLRGAERHVEGPSDAGLTIHEFVDFRCPQCAQARRVLSRLQHANPNDVRIVFRHYPLDQQCNTAMKGQVHPGACTAALAAECAGEQGKFWEYADLLFADQTKYKREDFEEHAKTAGLDSEPFSTCLDERRHESLVKSDIQEAHRIEIKATPTLVINGRVIRGIPPIKKLASLVTLQNKQLATQ